MIRICRNCGEKVKPCPDSGWVHDASNLDIVTSCMLPSGTTLHSTPRADPVDEGVLIIMDEERFYDEACFLCEKRGAILSGACMRCAWELNKAQEENTLYVSSEVFE